MKHLRAFPVALLFLSQSLSQGQTFEKYITGTYAQVGTAIEQTTDGGFILAGHTGSFGASSEYDLYLVRTDANGSLLWTRTFGRAASDLGYAVKQTTDGGFLVAGFSDSAFAAGRDVYLVRTDQNGNLLWSKTYGGPGYEIGYGLAITPDGGAIIVGETHYPESADIIIVRTDATGNALWTRTYDSGADDIGYSVSPVPLGGYIIAATSTTDQAKMALLRISDAGNLLWNKELSLNNLGEGRAAIATDDGYLVAGQLNDDACLVKTDTAGNVLWAKTYGIGPYSVVFCVRQTTDGGYVASGFQGNKTWLLRTDALGDTLWQHTYSFGLMAPNGVTPIAGGGYAICSNQLNALQFVRTDALGNIPCDMSANITEVSNVVPVVTSPFLSDSILTGMKPPITISGSGGTFTIPCETNGVDENGFMPNVSIAPNPAAEHFLVSFGLSDFEAIELVNMQGVVLLHMAAHGLSQVDVPVHALAQGAYLIRFKGRTPRTARVSVLR